MACMRRARATLVALSALMAVMLVASAAAAQAPPPAQNQQHPYTPPPRGAPDGRIGGASRDLTMESRVALVIGNAAYKPAQPLANPVNDANAMAETLRGLGFEVVAVDDADRTTMVKALG